MGLRSVAIFLLAVCAAGTAGASAAKAAEAGPAFEEVLSRPDDVELNLRYAKARYAAGEKLAALAALERVLAAAPDRHDARLLYGRVLLDLGYRRDAARVLAALARPEVPADIAKKRDSLFRRLARKPRPVQLFGSLGTGVDYHTNRNASPASGQGLFSDARVDLRDDSRRRGDTAYLFSVAAGARFPWAEGRHHGFFTLAHYRTEQANLKTLNMRSSALRLGAAWRLGSYSLIPSGGFEHMLLAQSDYMRTFGLGLRVERGLGSYAKVFLEGRSAYRTFHDNAEFPNGHMRNGNEVEALLGATLVPAKGLRFTLGARSARQNAAYQPYERERGGLWTELGWEAPSGAFARSSLGWDAHFYPRGPDYFVTAFTRRKDDAWRLALSGGYPIARPWVEGLLLSAGYEYHQSVSNIPNYSYTDNRVFGMLGWRWSLDLGGGAL